MKTVRQIMAETGAEENIALMKQMMAWPYDRKVYHAEQVAKAFYQRNSREGRNAHLSVGGLDSITLHYFLEEIGLHLPCISCSTLEQKGVQAVHRKIAEEMDQRYAEWEHDHGALTQDEIDNLPDAAERDREQEVLDAVPAKPRMVFLQPLKPKVQVIREFGWPVLSKEIAGKIALLQNPTQDNATVRHAILTGETGEYGGWKSESRMQLSRRWLALFGGADAEGAEQGYAAAPFRVSDRCCYYLKEKPCDDWANPVTIVVAAVGALTAGFLYLWNTCEPFKQFWLDLGANISAFVSNAGQAIANFFTVTLPNGITAAITWFQQLPANISAFLTQAVTSVGTWVSSMVAKAAEMGSLFLQNVVTFFTQLPYNLGYLLGSALATVASWTINMVNKAVEMGTQFLQNVVTFFVQLPDNIQNFVSAALANVTAWVAQMAQSAVQMGTQFLANVGSFFAQLPGNIANFLSNVLSNVSEWVTSMGQKAAEAASEFGRWLMDGLASLPDRVVEIGRRIVEGLWNGVTGAGGWLQDKIGSFVDGIVDGFQANFDINSPSKVMEDKIGWFLTPGIAQGMMKNMAPLKTAIGVVSDTIQSGFTGKLARLKSTISAGTPRNASVQTSTRGEVLDAIRTAAQMIVTAVQQSGGDLYIGDDVIYRSYNREQESQAIVRGGAF